MTRTKGRIGWLFACAWGALALCAPGFAETVNVKGAAKAFKYNGAAGSISFTVTGGQAGGQTVVTAGTQADWIHISPESVSQPVGLTTKGTGKGTVKYSVDAYTRSSPSPRTGVIQIADRTFTVSQTGVACKVTLTPTASSYPGAGDNGLFSVAAPDGCAWSASVDAKAPWIWIAGSPSGEGAGSVAFTVQGNDTTKSRSGKLYVTTAVPKPSKKTHSVKQLPGTGGGGGGGGGTLQLEKYDAGFFSIQKPVGWEVKTAGFCTTFAFVVRDPQKPLRQIFYFGTVGPVYKDAAEKQWEWEVTHGDTNVLPWVDAPLISPLTPGNFVDAWPEISHMWSATNFLPEFPVMDDLQVISSTPQSNMLAGVPGAETGLVRTIFKAGTSVGEGQFLLTVSPVPLSGKGYGNLVLGISAPSEEFANFQAKMVESLDSFTVTQTYVNWCMQQQAATWGAIAEAGRTLSEASDIVYDGWVQRTHSQDVSFYRWDDTYRDYDRLYDPDTGQVYLTEAGWYDANRDGLQMKDLEDLSGAPLSADQLYQYYNQPYLPQSAVH